MVSKRRRGRPRKTGQRYRSGKLKPASQHENPLTTARHQPHRKGLGDRVLDQRAESHLGRMYLREALTEPQLLAAECYAALWQTYLGTLDGPTWPGRGQGRGLACSGCPTPGDRENCACELARRAWVRCWDRLVLVGHGCAVLVTRTCCYDDVVCPPERFPLLCQGLDALALHLGLTNQRKRAT